MSVSESMIISEKIFEMCHSEKSLESVMSLDGYQ